MHDARLGLVFRSEKFGLPSQSNISDDRVRRLRDEFENVWKDWSRLIDVTETIKADQTAPEDARKLRIKKFAESKITAVAERALKAINEAESEVARIEKTFTATLEPRSPAVEMRRATLRQSLLNLPDSQRTDVVRQALLNNDRAMLDAIGSGLQFECGVIGLHYSEARAKLFELSMPADYSVYGALKENAARLENAAANFASCAVSEVIPPDATLIQHKQEAAREAEKGETNVAQ